MVALVALAFTLNGDRRKLYVSLAILLFFTSYPLLILFQLGQIDLLLASLTILSLACERLKHKSVSAAVLSMAVLLKGNPFFLLIYFVIFRKDWSYLVRFLISTLAIIGLSLLIVPIQLYWYYAVTLVPRLSSSVPWIRTGGGIADFIPGVLAFADIARMVSIAGYCLFAIFSFWASSKRFSTVNRTLSADGMFLMNVLVMLLFGPTDLGSIRTFGSFYL